MLSRQQVVLNTYSYTGFILFTVLCKLFSGECGAYLLSRSYSSPISAVPQLMRCIII